MTRLIFDIPTTRAEIDRRIGEAMTRHETALCAAIALGICVEIAVCVARTAALYPVGP